MTVHEVVAEVPGRREPWRNWSGSVRAEPRVVRPRSTAEVRDVVVACAERGLRVRPVGSGHSFTPLAATDEVQVDVSALRGLVAVDGRRATLRAGTTLNEASRLLARHGLALENLGDIDAQTLAGALATGTHGTGARFGTLASRVVGIELVTGRGELLTLTPDDGATFLAAAVSLGALGIVTAVTVSCVHAFQLSAVEAREPLEEVLAGIDARVRAVDHFELYWFPYTGWTQTKANTRVPRIGREATDGGAAPGRPSDGGVPRWRRRLGDELMSNAAFAVVNRLGLARPGLVPALNRASARLVSARTFTDDSHEVFATPRRVRFVESEFAVPRAAVGDVLRELRRWVLGHPEVAVQFPVEVRFTAGDAPLLSMAHGRESAFIAVHQYRGARYAPYFHAFEAIALAHEGRPHWGKLHRLGADELARRYPRFGEFRAVRDRLDPARVFVSPYLERLLGI